MMAQHYVLLKKGLTGSPQLVDPTKVMDIVEDDLSKDWYQSVYYYNDSHTEILKKNGSLRGVTNVKTDKLIFDFDDSVDSNNARLDAIEVCKRLTTKNNIPEKDIEVYYSGSKGFHLIITLDKLITPEQSHIGAMKIAGDLKTFDASIYNASRILRVVWTRNQKTGLYKIPLKVSQLALSMKDIRDIAKDIDNVKEEFSWNKTTLPDVMFQQKEEHRQEFNKNVDTLINETDIKTIMENKPRHWPDYKWALLNAIEVKPDERHEALMRLSATCRSLGYTKEMARALCLTFDDKFMENTGKSPVRDLDHNILRTIYSDRWNGGSYSLKNDFWLQQYTKRLGIDTSKEMNKEDTTISIDSAFDMFKDYAVNIDRLTIKTGIEPLDEKARMTIGMSVGIVAAPSVGKTTLALQILNNMSNTNEQSIFFSYDMYHALVFQKLIQKHLKISDTEIFERFKNDDKDFQKKVIETLKKEYQNVEFCFKTGQTPDQIEETIKMTEEKTGKKIRLVVVDYSELVLTDHSDMTASSAQVAQKLREIATKLNVCMLVLLQPNKMAGTPADELKSYRGMKGSSSAEQALSIILGMSRPGYNPRRPEDDQFITIKCLKNRMGELFTLDLGWRGSTGEIYELDDLQEQILTEIRERKAAEEANEGSGSDWN